jgi:hypothetical protein
MEEFEINWQAITGGAEIIGLIFILISVFYLAKQVKHTNTLSMAESLRDATQLYTQQYKESFGTEKRAAFMRKALNDYENLSQDEKAGLFSIILGYIGAWDNLYTKHQAGFLQDETYNSITIAFSSLLQTPGGLACIEQINESFTLPPYIMDKTVVKNIAGFEVRPYTDCLDFLKINS